MNANNPEVLIYYSEMSVESWRRFRPQSDGYWLTVSLDRNGRLVPIGRKLSGPFASRPTGVFWVNVAVHHASFQVEVPTSEHTLNFVVQAHLSWRITDPVRAIRDNVRAAELVYRPIVEQHLRAMGRQFDVDRFLDAEQHVNSFFASRTLELGCGLTLLECRVQLRPDAETLSHLRRRTLNQRAEERRLAEHHVTLRDAEFEHEIANLKGQNSIAREQIRMEHYLSALRDGDLSLFALQLASRRDDVGKVIDQLIVQRDVNTQSAREIITLLLDKGMLNKRDGDQLLAKVNALIDSATKPTSVAGSDSAPDIELTASAIIADTASLSALDTEPDDEEDEEDEGA
ncbi:SPFH domain-containing protein [Nocardia pseudobrasiliensis]|uniref:SPFH domain/Band 7 family protein n=1 Tax=Nocardia pseudobrasiliensis TaxID=45979 RepID=A0A370IE82_9NOCA|nr:SPFH domain-containing protein [Nocardia pseudobrasiliensis]RDI69032.1 hypothetical protein DFR76_101570 [Nocardia pseudobrasiliensis]